MLLWDHLHLCYNNHIDTIIMTNTIQQIADQINAFDYFYEMSDDTRKFDLGRKAQAAIKSQLAELSESELIEVRDLLTANMDHVCRYFGKFFNDLPEPTPAIEAAEVSYKSEIFRTAWALFKEGVFESFGRALCAAWKRYKLVSRLKQGLAYFSFSKATGEVREAIGTLASNNFNYNHKTAKKESNPALIKYWDIQKRAFRSCRLDRLISLNS